MSCAPVSPKCTSRLRLSSKPRVACTGVCHRIDFSEPSTCRCRACTRAAMAMMSGSTSLKVWASSICRCSGAAGASDIMLLRSVWRIWLLRSRGRAGAGVPAVGAEAATPAASVLGSVLIASVPPVPALASVLVASMPVVPVPVSALVASVLAASMLPALVLAISVPAAPAAGDAAPEAAGDAVSVARGVCSRLPAMRSVFCSRACSANFSSAGVLFPFWKPLRMFLRSETRRDSSRCRKAKRMLPASFDRRRMPCATITSAAAMRASISSASGGRGICGAAAGVSCWASAFVEGASGAGAVPAAGVASVGVVPAEVASVGTVPSVAAGACACGTSVTTAVTCGSDASVVAAGASGVDTVPASGETCWADAASVADGACGVDTVPCSGVSGVAGVEGTSVLTTGARAEREQACPGLCYICAPNVSNDRPVR